jgi:hypothetical protein
VSDILAFCIKEPTVNIAQLIGVGCLDVGMGWEGGIAGCENGKTHPIELHSLYGTSSITLEV